ncbi:hypothetical protein GC169_10010 [bacterium]|nr:hypothetical protein [bacterium]
MSHAPPASSRLAAIGVLTGLLAISSCGEVEDQYAEFRTPENVQAKTAAIIAPDAPGSVTVSDIRLTERPGGKGIILVWRGNHAGVDYTCNSDRKLDLPMCERVSD